MSRFSRKLFLTITFFLFICFPLSASAHSYIVKSDPSANQFLQNAPKEVRIRFNEPIQAVFDSLSVYDQSGVRVDLNDVHLDTNNPSILVCGIKQGLGKGNYTINWRVISGDGHPVQGVIPFQVGIIGNSSGAALTTGYLPGPDMVILRTLEYLSLTIFVGLLFFRMAVLPDKLKKQLKMKRRFRTILWVSWMVLLASIVLYLPLQITIDAGVTWREAWNSALLAKGIQFTQFGRVWLMQLVLLLALVPATNLGIAKEDTARSRWWFPAFFIGACLVFSKSFISHAAGTRNPDFSITVDFLHLIAASIWVGSLFGMVMLLDSYRLTEPVEKKGLFLETMRRFSPWGITSVAALLATGLYASLMNFPNWNSLFATRYGQILLIKLALVLIMILLGSVHFWQARRLQNLSVSLSRTIRLQFAVGVLVLMVTSVLTNLPTAMAKPGPFHKTQVLKGGVNATLHVSPNAAGINTFNVDLIKRDGKPDTDVQQMTLTFTMLDMDMGSDTVKAVQVAPGKFHLEGMYLTMAGNWRIHVHVLASSFEDQDADFNLFVGSP